MLASSNRKTGLCSATYVAQRSCGRCRFKGAGCYAEGGCTGFTTRRLNAEADAADLSPIDLAESEAEALRELAPVLDLRLHVLGDCNTGVTSRIVSRAAAKWAANGRKVWAYTHGPRMRREDWNDVSCLASVETVPGIRSALRRGFVPALTVEKFPSRVFTVAGVRFVSCPEQVRGVECVSCRLCFDDENLRRRQLGIAFAIHGAGVKRISLPVLAAA